MPKTVGFCTLTAREVLIKDIGGGSRRQELQRAGRVMHSDGIGRHVVQMTDEEHEKYGRRLYSLEEKGMDIRLERRGEQ